MADLVPQGSPLGQVLMTRCEEITPHASNPLTNTSAAIRVNVSGLVTMRFKDGSADVQLYLLAGVDYPYRVTNVRITGTDAAVITGKLFALN